MQSTQAFAVIVAPPQRLAVNRQNRLSTPVAAAAVARNDCSQFTKQA